MADGARTTHPAHLLRANPENANGHWRELDNQIKKCECASGETEREPLKSTLHRMRAKKDDGTDRVSFALQSVPDRLLVCYW